MPNRRHAVRHRRPMEGNHPVASLDKPMRTSELLRSIPGITERMLIRHLKDLVSDGILIRRKEPDTPSRLLLNLGIRNDDVAGARSNLRMGKKAHFSGAKAEYALR